MFRRFTRLGGDMMGKRKKILVFISTGDTCRAPMASGYFKKLLAERGWTHIEVRDAGIMTVAGLRATPEAIQVLDTVDVDLRRHSSRKLSNESIKRADLILGMSSFHVQTALRQSDMARNKTFLLKEFVGWHQKNVQISDPMGGTLEVYKACFSEIKDCCDRLIDMDFITGKSSEPPKPAAPVESPAKGRKAKAGKKAESEEAKAESAKESETAKPPAADKKSAVAEKKPAPEKKPAGSDKKPAPEKKAPPAKSEPAPAAAQTARKPTAPAKALHAEKPQPEAKAVAKSGSPAKPEPKNAKATPKEIAARKPVVNLPPAKNKKSK